MGRRKISMKMIPAKVIIPSPGGKPYSFGHPSVDMVASRSLRGSPPEGANVSVLIQGYNDLLQRVEAAQKKCEEIKLGTQNCPFPKAPANQLILMKLLECEKILEKINEKVAKGIRELSLKDIGIPSSFATSERSIDLNVANPAGMETYGSP